MHEKEKFISVLDTQSISRFIQQPAKDRGEKIFIINGGMEELSPYKKLFLLTALTLNESSSTPSNESPKDPSQKLKTKAKISFSTFLIQIQKM